MALISSCAPESNYVLCICHVAHILTAGDEAICHAKPAEMRMDYMCRISPTTARIYMYIDRHSPSQSVAWQRRPSAHQHVLRVKGGGSSHQGREGGRMDKGEGGGQNDSRRTRVWRGEKGGLYTTGSACQFKHLL